MGALAVGPWLGKQKPLGKTPLGGNPTPETTYLPTSLGRPSRPTGQAAGAIPQGRCSEPGQVASVTMANVIRSHGRNP